MSWDLADVTASLGTLHVGPRHQDQLFTKELVDYKKVDIFYLEPIL
jgi:hypothetical protein